MDQLALPITIVAPPTKRCSRCRRRAATEPLQVDEQLSLSLRPCGRPRRTRPCNPNAAAHALALAHLDLADKIAGNFARRTTHSFDDLRQLAVIGLLKAAARFDGTGGRSFRPYARTYANGEITHYLRDHGFAIKVPPSWRDTYASGQKLLREGLPSHAVPQRLGISAERWREIQSACSITVIALQPDT
jgi:DNA-directed RNA polymerase specialized sigma subunit